RGLAARRRPCNKDRSFDVEWLVHRIPSSSSWPGLTGPSMSCFRQGRGCPARSGACRIWTRFGMKYTLTLIGNNASPLRDEHVDAAAACLPAPAAPDWLAPALACDLSFEAGDGKAIEAHLRARFEGARIDMAVQAVDRAGNGRRKMLLVADMDSTIIQQECIDELAAE